MTFKLCVLAAVLYYIYGFCLSVEGVAVITCPVDSGREGGGEVNTFFFVSV